MKPARRPRASDRTGRGGGDSIGLRTRITGPSRSKLGPRPKPAYGRADRRYPVHWQAGETDPARSADCTDLADRRSRSPPLCCHYTAFRTRLTARRVGTDRRTVVAALLLCALVPRTAISIACGALFGPIGGGFIGLVAAMLAAVATFAAGRGLGREAVEARARLTLVPARFLAVRRVCSRSRGPDDADRTVRPDRLRLRDDLRTPVALPDRSLIGATPSAFTYSAVGAAAVKPGAVRLVTFLPAALGLLVTLCAAVYWHRTGRRARPPSEPDRDGAEPHERSRTS